MIFPPPHPVPTHPQRTLAPICATGISGWVCREKQATAADRFACIAARLTPAPILETRVQTLARLLEACKP